MLGPAGLSDDDIRRAAMADISEQGSGDLGGFPDWLAPRDPGWGPADPGCPDRSRGLCLVWGEPRTGIHMDASQTGTMVG